MRRARRPRLQGATTKAMLVSIVLGTKRRVMKQSGDLRGPDRTRTQRGSAIGLPPRRRHLDRGTAPVALTAARPEGWRPCVSPLMRTHVSGPPADVVVFINTGTKSGRRVPRAIFRGARSEADRIFIQGDCELDGGASPLALYFLRLVRNVTRELLIRNPRRLRSLTPPHFQDSLVEPPDLLFLPAWIRNRDADLFPRSGGARALGRRLAPGR